MRSLRWFRSKPLPLLSGVLAVTLLLAVACGAAATATPAAPAAKAAVAPLAPEVKAPAPAAPKAAPAATPVPAPTVHPGKVTFMVGNWEGARMTPLHVVSQNYGMIVHGFLVATDEKRGLIPGIATDWKASEDGKTWTFTIRDGVKFHNGQPLTAEDVTFTWLHNWGPGVVEKSTSSTSQNQARNTVKIEQLDPKRVSITTKIPDSSIPFFLADAVGSVQGIVLPRWELDKIHDPDRVLAYDRNPIAAAIMMLNRHVPAELMAFERFDDYYQADRRVKFRSLDLRQVPEEATRVAALRAGEADIAPISLASKGQLEAGGARVVFGQEGTYLYARFRESWIPGFPINKKEVRQALAYALDLRVFRDRLFGPEVYVPKGWNHATPSTLGYSPELDPYPYDPEKARQLLAQAGYPGGKGFPTLIVHTWNSRATALLPESAQLAADMWKKDLGIPVEVRLGDEATFKKDWNTEGALRGQILWRDNEPRVDGGNIIRGTFGTPAANGRQHNDPAVFKQAQEAIGIFDLAQRAEAYNKFYRVIRDEVYEVGLGYQNIPWGVGTRVKEWSPFPLSFWPSGLHTIVLK